MIKTIPPGAYEFAEPSAQMVKLSSRGLIADDLRTFVKRAGHTFLPILANVKLAKGEIPVHIIALGCTERTGPNRNGDGFPEEALIEHSHTFEKMAYPFRDHINRDPAKRYGRVIKAAYNRAMGRTELLVGYNGSKEAIAQNGGFLADKEVDKLERGEDLGVSMACEIAHDFCSSCHNKAANQREYCTEATCKHGGLKHNMGRVCADGHHLHAINLTPRFFDISHIVDGRPADRIAYSLGVLKEAADRGVSGAALAEHLALTLPDRLLDADVLPIVKAARLLADIEAKVTPFLSGDAARCWAKVAAPSPPACLSRDPELIHAAMQAEVSLPVNCWLDILVGDGGQTKIAANAVQARLPGVFSRLAALPELPVLAKAATAYLEPIPVSEMAATWAEQTRAAWGIDPQSVRRRVSRSAISGSPATQRKQASAVIGDRTELAAEQLAVQYALYKAAMLARMLARNSENSAAATLLVQQNHLS